MTKPTKPPLAGRITPAGGGARVVEHTHGISLRVSRRDIVPDNHVVWALVRGSDRAELINRPAHLGTELQLLVNGHHLRAVFVGLDETQRAEAAAAERRALELEGWREAT